MKSVAVVSSGFLRNYRSFLRSRMHRMMTAGFACDFYISAWEEDGYGSSWTPEYTSNLIPEQRVREDFGPSLKFLRMESFAAVRDSFRYEPVRSLLREEPQVLEKYRSKFYSLKRVEVPPGYDAYLHMRFDIDPYEEISICILDALAAYRSSSNTIHTSQDIFDRPGCFGDIFQVLDYESLSFMMGFYDRLYDPSYLDLDIPVVPELVLQRYFDLEMPQKRIVRIPLDVRINREVLD
jgi:hypothetical protein